MRQLLFEGWIGALSGLALALLWHGLALWRVLAMGLVGGALNRAAVDIAWATGTWASAQGLPWTSGAWVMSTLSSVLMLLAANVLCYRRTTLRSLVLAAGGALLGMAVFTGARQWAGQLAAWQFALNWGLWIAGVSVAHALSSPPRSDAYPGRDFTDSS